MARKKIVALVIASAVLVGCSKEHPVTVGSKNFTEQVILGEIIAQHLENRLRAGVKRQLNLGGTLLAHQALVSGNIDLYPEYTGTALLAVLKDRPESDPGIVLARVRSEYQRRFGIDWLDPLGFNDSFAMAVRGGDARVHKLETLSQAAAFRPGWKLGVGYEFLSRPDGYKSLMKTYGLPIAGPPKSMDLGLLYKALADNQVNMIAANTTDGLLAISDVKVLRDDRGAFPPYQACLAVRDSAFQQFPGLRQALGELSGRITEAAMRRMNYQVDVEHRRETQVAREFLAEAGLAR